MWFTLAAAQGDKNAPDERGVKLFGTSKYTALEQRDRVAALMTPAQIAEAERLACEWKPRLLLEIRPRKK